MPEPGPLLLLHGGDERMSVTAHRLRRLGYRVIGAKTPAHALVFAAGRRPPVGALLIPAELVVPDLGQAIAELREAFGESVGWLVVGRRPHVDTCRELREAGVELAAWEPADDGVLRFQLNRALAGHGARSPRSATRVPANLPARVSAAGRTKPAMVRALSESGAFLETVRPSLPGVDLAIEVSIAAPETVLAMGRVVYANVPGNLRRANLPTGMAVRFTRLGEDAERAIRRCVARRALALVV